MVYISPNIDSGIDGSQYIKKSLSEVSQAQIVILRGSESPSSKGRDRQQQLSHSNLRSWSFRFTSDIGMIQTKWQAQKTGYMQSQVSKLCSLQETLNKSQSLSFPQLDSTSFILRRKGLSSWLLIEATFGRIA